jgi:hypothetical protein
MTARTVGDFRATSIIDPDVIRAVARGMRRDPWVLVTMDAGIVENHPGFEWQRYAIAWVLIDPHLSGVAVEHAKTDVAQRHAHQMVEQRPNDHFSYTAHARHKQATVAPERAEAFGPIPSLRVKAMAGVPR